MIKAEHSVPLATEQQNTASTRLDAMSALEIARLMNAEDAKVPRAMRKALPQIARAIDLIAGVLERGGRLIYVGAGSSGRLGALDALECPPTFNIGPRRVQYVIAGGPRALGVAVEAKEDSPQWGRRDLAAQHLSRKDVVVGIAASGRTPYTVAALEYAREKGAATVCVVSNPGSPLEKTAGIPIVIEVGPEVLTGSTRLKAGTAQKLVLNMLSTGAMARLGYLYGNLMVNVQPKNRKLRERSISILERAAKVTRDQAALALEAAADSVPVALVMLQAGLSRAQAQHRLKAAQGRVRAAIAPATPQKSFAAK